MIDICSLVFDNNGLESVKADLDCPGLLCGKIFELIVAGPVREHLMGLACFVAGDLDFSADADFFKLFRICNGSCKELLRDVEMYNIAFKSLPRSNFVSLDELVRPIRQVEPLAPLAPTEPL